MGISVEGRIALARYGNVFRGLKVWQAEERGAVGVLIYSDPADDGYTKGGRLSGRTHATPIGDSTRLGPVPLASTR